MVAAVRFPELIIICVTISSLAQAVMYNVTMYIAETPNAASMAEVIISLIGTEGESERKSLGSVSTTTSAYVSTSNLGYIKTLVTEKKQTGTMNDDNLQFVKVTVTSDANAQKFEFVCPLPYCNIRFPNLVVKLHTGVDGQWSQWSNWRCECEAENNRRTRDRKCDNPAPYFTGAVCVGSNVDTIINGCFSVTEDFEADECKGRAMCAMYCVDGFKRGDDGCVTCTCNDDLTHCSNISCRIHCKNGFETGPDGCEVCKCRPKAS